MIQFLLGIVFVGCALVLAFVGAGPAAAIPLLFIGGGLLMAGLIGMKGGSFEGLATLGTSPCPHCEQHTARNASICKFCGGKLETLPSTWGRPDRYR